MTHTSPALMVTVPRESGLDLLLQLYTTLGFFFLPFCNLLQAYILTSGSPITSYDKVSSAFI